MDKNELMEFLTNMLENNVREKLQNKKALLYSWYHSIANDGLFFDENSNMIFDYEVEQIIENEILSSLSFDAKVRIRNPYLIIQNIAIPVELLAKMLEIDEDNIQHIMEDNLYIIDCRELSQQDVLDAPTKKDFVFDFLSYIKKMGNHSVMYDDDLKNQLHDFKNSIKFLLEFNDSIGIHLDTEDRQIAIAIDMYIPDAKDVVSQKLGLSPEMFVEVSSPFNSVLVIDCEKVFAVTELYNLDDSAWLI